MKLSAVAILGGMAMLASATDSNIVKRTTESEHLPAYPGYGANGEMASEEAPAPQTGYEKPAAVPARGKYHRVDVGAKGQLIFSPNSVDAAVGDIIEFNFLALNHSLTQSEFDTPCTFNGGFDSGFMPNPENKTGVFLKSIVVKDTKPLWFYCKQPMPASHCGAGMVFGINPAGKMDQFIENAKKQNGPSSTPTTMSTMQPAAYPTATPTYTEEQEPAVTVTVGLDAGRTLKFEPEFLQHVEKGTKIRFDFRALNHTLTESSFNDPCKKLNENALDTDFMHANPEDIEGLKTFDFTLDTEEDQPRWFYCKQGNGSPTGHCGQGMVFAINPKSVHQFNMFLEKAEATLPRVRGRGMVLGQ